MADQLKPLLGVGFDVDGTLINADDEWSMRIVNIAAAFADAGATIYVLSNGGREYAETWGKRLSDFDIPVAGFFNKRDDLARYHDKIHIVFDDSPVGLLGMAQIEVTNHTLRFHEPEARFVAKGKNTNE